MFASFMSLPIPTHSEMHAAKIDIDVGGADWKPFFPTDTTRIHRFAQHIAASDELDFTSEELPFGPNLINEIIDSWNKRQIVVLIVDGWSLHWNNQYRAVLSQLDQRLDVHWCARVPPMTTMLMPPASKNKIDMALKTTFVATSSGTESSVLP